MDLLSYLEPPELATPPSSGGSSVGGSSGSSNGGTSLGGLGGTGLSVTSSNDELLALFD